MNPELLEEILGCTSLPSLPAVAVRVIELTSDPDVQLPVLAETIQNDQALAGKILRTVNSSFYGLRERCGSINKALVMLGLRPVKSLALGFSIVTAVGDGKGEEGGFNYVSYWRRGIYTAAAAKVFAGAWGKDFGDEAFLAGLMQDIGVMAMYRALGQQYVDIMSRCADGHSELVKHELAELDLQHPEVGAMLVQRWRLPEQLVQCVKFHERPTAAPLGASDLTRCVAIGNIAHDVLTDAEPAEAMRRLYARAKQWLNLDPPDVEAAMKQVGDAAKELSNLFKLDTGKGVVAEDIVAQANDKLIEIAKSGEYETPVQGGLDALLTSSSESDPLTGAVSKSGFETALRKAFDAARQSDEPLSVVEVLLDDWAGLNRRQSPEDVDELVLGVVSLLRKRFDSLGGITCRLAPQLFAVVLPGADRVSVTRLADEFRAELTASGPHWLGEAPLAKPVTVSVGVSSMQDAEAGTFTSAVQLASAAAHALKNAAQNGGDRVCGDVASRAA
ncbi:MAG: HDOD domain-containing protein [Phycisphaerales bacterium]|jgi:diguanylate cyclase (GGDEF)-like protein|nr:HDOD domain-containing protein [Phycisphaerales bacterium]